MEMQSAARHDQRGTGSGGGGADEAGGVAVTSNGDQAVGWVSWRIWLVAGRKRGGHARRCGFRQHDERGARRKDGEADEGGHAR